MINKKRNFKYLISFTIGVVFNTLAVIALPNYSAKDRFIISMAVTIMILIILEVYGKIKQINNN